MFFHFNGHELAQAVKSAARIIDKKHTLTHTRLIRVEARGASLYIQATDHSQVLETTCEATTANKGTFFVDAATLQKALKGFADAPATGQVISGFLVLYQEDENLRIEIPAVENDVWPELEREDEPDQPDASAELSGDWLRQVGKTFRGCVSRFTDRPTMTGVCFDFSAEPALVATDGRRLAVAEIPSPRWQRGGPGELRPVVPGKTMEALHHLGKGQAITCELTPKHFTFKGEGWRIWGRTIEGRYPNHAKVVPGDPAAICFINRARLRQVLKHLILFANCPRSPGLCIFNFVAGSGLLVQVAHPDDVRAGYMIPCQHGPHDLRLGFNARYLLDYLDSVSGETLQIDLQDASKSALLSCGNAPRYVIMPVKIDRAGLGEELEGAA